MLRLALLLAIPAWSAVMPALARAGGRRAAWVATIVVALAFAAWAGSRIGTANPISRTARWDPWLMFAMGSVLLAIPAAGTTWGALAAVADGRPWWLAAGAGTLAGVAALPVAFVVAVLVEVLWPH